MASSLRELFHPLRQRLLENDPAIHLEPIFGASSTLARQLSLGAPIELFISADAEIVEDLIQRGFLDRESRLEFAHGELVLVGDPKWPIRNSALSALESQELKSLAIPSEAVPLGRYARAWLDSHGLLDRLRGKIVVTEHARATLASVDAGLVDLAIVYRSDARLAKTAAVLALIDSRE
ncbi:MAG: molybdate ABC transporter substrate-binding protein, partial [Myxococcota bacterium]